MGNSNERIQELEAEVEMLQEQNRRLFRLLQEFKNRELTFHTDIEWLMREHNRKEQER